MKTMSFSSVESFTIGGNFSRCQEAGFAFIVENKDVVIKSITPIANYVAINPDSGDYSGGFQLNTSPKIRTLDNGRLFYSPVKMTGGYTSPYEGLMVPNIVNYVEIRLLAGQVIEMLIPFQFTYKYEANTDFDVEIHFGFIVSYEEVERKIFK